MDALIMNRFEPLLKMPSSIPHSESPSSVENFATRKLKLKKGLLRSHRPQQASWAKPHIIDNEEGPGPQTYSYIGKPLNEINAPAYSFGRKCVPEKNYGSRKSWQKSWFMNDSVWTNKVDFLSESCWPSPSQYTVKNYDKRNSPRHSMGRKLSNNSFANNTDKANQPAPNEYNLERGFQIILPQTQSFSHQFRRNGTMLSVTPETTPGPAAYLPLLSGTKHTSPRHSFQYSRRRPFKFENGPFSAF